MIKVIELKECRDPKFIKPKKMIYKQDGVIKDWEIALTHDSVAILLYHVEKDSFVLVKQFRPPVFLKNSNGMTIELCAGLVDKDKSLAQIAKEEILEECGYDIDLKRVQKITSFYTSVGSTGSKQTLYFAKVSDSDKVGVGGGIDGEDIEIIYLPIKKAKEFMLDESIAKTPGLLFAFMWYFDLINKGEV